MAGSNSGLTSFYQRGKKPRYSGGAFSCAVRMAGMDKEWTDDEVLEYLVNERGIPLARWRLFGNTYGHVAEDGKQYGCADDNPERARRVVEFLNKNGAPRFGLPKS